MATSPLAVIAPAVRGAALGALGIVLPFLMGMAVLRPELAALMGFGGFAMGLADVTGTLRNRVRGVVLGAIGLTVGIGVGTLLDVAWPVVAVIALGMAMFASRALLLPGPGRLLVLFPLLAFALGVGIAPTVHPLDAAASVLAGAAIGGAIALIRVPLSGAQPLGAALVADLQATAGVFDAVGGDEAGWRRARTAASRAATAAIEAAEAASAEAPQLAATGRLRAAAASLRLHDGPATGAATARRVATTLRALLADPSSPIAPVGGTTSADVARRGLDELVDDLRRGPQLVPPPRLIRPFLVVLLHAPWRRSLAARHGLRLGLGLAALIAVWQVADLRYEAWALMALILVATPRTGETVQRGRDRATGTIVGVGIAILVLPVAGDSTAATAAAIAVAGLALHLVRSRGYAWLVAPATVIVLLLVHAAIPTASTFAEAGYQLVATGAGIAAALLLNRIALPDWSPNQLQDAVAATLDALADHAEGGSDTAVLIDLADVAEACAARDTEPADRQAATAWGDDALAALRRTNDAIRTGHALGEPMQEAAQELRALASWVRGALEIPPVARATWIGPNLLDAELAALRIAIEQGVRVGTPR